MGEAGALQQTVHKQPRRCFFLRPSPWGRRLRGAGHGLAIARAVGHRDPGPSRLTTTVSMALSSTGISCSQSSSIRKIQRSPRGATIRVLTPCLPCLPRPPVCLSLSPAHLSRDHSKRSSLWRIAGTAQETRSRRQSASTDWCPDRERREGAAGVKGEAVSKRRLPAAAPSYNPCVGGATRRRTTRRNACLGRP